MNNSIYKIVSVAIFLMTTVVGFGQVIPNHSQYMMNPYLINPAAAGVNDNHEFFTHLRAQWVSFPTAPETKFLTYSGRFNRNGLGIQLYNDKAGAFEVNSFLGTYNYHIPTTATSNLSIGLSMQYLDLNLNPLTSTLQDIDLGDELILDAMNGINLLESSIGAYYYNENGFYAGLSAPNIIRTKIGGMAASDVRLLSPNFIFYGGYKFNLKKAMSFSPSVLVRKLDGNPAQVELNGQLWFLNEHLMIGGSYRTGEETFIAMFGFQLANTLKVFYSYDASFNDISNYSTGSSELTVGIQLHKLKKEEVPETE